MDVGAWLRGLGLGQYEQAFRDNDIDAGLLPTLTADDLRELGVASLGHRKRLLAAIAALAPPNEPQPSPPDPSPVSTGRQAERRQLTVMFVDLVGSTALSARLDPEDLRELIGAYHRRVAAAIERLGGFVAKYMGDGVLAYFGYPRAHEDDAERAVRAGLELVTAVRDLEAPAGTALRVRVGIATGLVVVGDLLGSGAAQEQAVVGETPNLAARLQALAEPDSVVIAAGTRRLVGDLFECADLGAVEAKGFAGPVRAYRVLGVGAAASRFEAFHAAALAPLVGREEELGLLLRRWRAGQGAARAGWSCSRASRGSASRGCSRRCRSGSARSRTSRLRYFCSPHHQDSPLHPVIAQLERAAGFARGDPPEARLAKLEALLAPTSPPAEDVALLAELLSLPPGERYAAAAAHPAAQARADLRGAAAPARAAVGPRPGADDLRGRALDRPELARAARPRGRARGPAAGPAADHLPPRVRAALDRPAARDGPGARPPRSAGGRGARAAGRGRSCAARRAGGRDRRAHGRRAAVRRGADQGGARGRRGRGGRDPRREPAGGAGGAGHAPRLAHGAARPPRPGGQGGGAGRGRDRPGVLPRAAGRRGGPRARASWRRRSTSSPAPGWSSGAARGRRPATCSSTRWCATRPTARSCASGGGGSTPPSRAPWRSGSPSWPETTPELLAHHLTEAGEAERAVRYWLEAGRRSAERSADREAVSHLRRGLEVLAGLPASAERDRMELDFQLAIGTPLIALSGWSGPQVAAAYERAGALCDSLGETEHLVPALFGLASNRVVRGQTRAAQRLAERCRAAGRAPAAIPVDRLLAHRAMGAALMQLGALRQARAEFEAIPALYDPERDRGLAARCVTDPRASGLSFLALVLWIMGYPDQARRTAGEASGYAAALQHANTTGHVLCHGGGGELAHLLRDVPATRGHAEAVIALAAEHDMPMWRGYGLVLRGWVLAEEGSLEEGASLVRQGIAELDALGTVFHRSHHLGLLAGIHARLGDPAAGLRVLEEALRRGGADRGAAVRGRAPSARGGAAAPRRGTRGEVEACFAEALAVARRQEARSFELRAATSLARLWRDRGGARKRTTCSPRSTAGSPKGSTRRTCGMRRHCSMGSGERAGPTPSFKPMRPG